VPQDCGSTADAVQPPFRLTVPSTKRMDSANMSQSRHDGQKQWSCARIQAMAISRLLGGV
jgi:hypothetical protein